MLAVNENRLCDNLHRNGPNIPDAYRSELQALVGEQHLVTMKLAEYQRRRVFVASLGSAPKLSPCQASYAHTWTIKATKTSEPLHIGEGFCIKFKTSLNGTKQWVSIESCKGDHGGLQWIVENWVDPTVRYETVSHLAVAASEIPAFASELSTDLNCALRAFSKRKDSAGQFVNAGHLLGDTSDNKLVSVLQTNRFSVQIAARSIHDRLQHYLGQARDLWLALGHSQEIFTFENGDANGQELLRLSDDDSEWKVSVLNPAAASHGMYFEVLFTEISDGFSLKIFDARGASNGDFGCNVALNTFAADFCECLSNLLKDKTCIGVSVPQEHKSEILLYLAARQ